MDPASVFIILLSLIGSAFFSSMEIAFLSSSRLKVELEKTKGTIQGKIMGLFYKNDSFFIALLLLGNNIALVLFGLYAADILEPILEQWLLRSNLISGIGSGHGLVLLIQTILSTLFILIIAEFIPKALVQLNPDSFLKVAGLLMWFIYWLLYIPTQFIMGISSLVLRLIKTDHRNTKQYFSKIDLEHYVQDLYDRIDEEQELGNEVQILQNALDFSSLKVRDCMIPRTEIVALDVEDPIELLNDTFINTGLSKIIIYRDSIDHVIGYVHSFEMFKQPLSIKQILLPIAFVPSAAPGKELLELFTKRSGNIAVVLDEYGGTAGLVTIEDVVEEIFGEIEDEHDKEDWLEERISDTEYRFSARVEIDYANETYKLQLPESEEYETLGGLVIHALETIPEAGTTLELEKHTLIIEEVSDRKIEIVRVLLDR